MCDLRQVLLEADRPQWYAEKIAYSGGEVDVLDAIRRANLVRKELTKEFRRYFTIEDDQQDAFFWGEISDLLSDNRAPDRPIIIRFSYCGDLASTCSIEGFQTLFEDEKRKIEIILKKHGFKWIDGEVLKKMEYDGAYDYFKVGHYNAPASWWDRFFEYE